jgi:hypothetical protein
MNDLALGQKFSNRVKSKEKDCEGEGWNAHDTDEAYKDGLLL